VVVKTREAMKERDQTLRGKREGMGDRGGQDKRRPGWGETGGVPAGGSDHVKRPKEGWDDIVRQYGENPRENRRLQSTSVSISFVGPAIHRGRYDRHRRSLQSN